MEQDLRLEKTLETLRDTFAKRLPKDVRSTCPALVLLNETIELIKTENSSRIADELGISSVSFSCPRSKKG